MTEPAVGPDRRGMRTSGVPHGGDLVVNGTNHVISHADHSNFVILFAASGEESTPRGVRPLVTALRVDLGTPGFEVLPGYRNVSSRLAALADEHDPARGACRS